MPYCLDDAGCGSLFSISIYQVAPDGNLVPTYVYGFKDGVGLLLYSLITQPTPAEYSFNMSKKIEKSVAESEITLHQLYRNGI